MSEVNQAFLRAYLKNRTAQAQATANANQEVSTPSQDSTLAKPSGMAARQRSAPTAQPTRSLPSGESIRIDAGHANSNTNSVQAAPRQGIWNGVGVERGMKAMESKSLPARMSNPAIANTSAATPSQPIGKADTARENVSFTQVMYVDGLGQTEVARPSSDVRRSEKTLAEIAEPIAVGTGLQDSPSKRPFGIHQRSSNPPVDLVSSIGTDVSRRLDGTHGSQIEKQTSPGGTLPSGTPAAKKSVDAQSARPQAALPLPIAFTPSWEVDLFYWPEVVKHIEKSQPDAFHQIGKHLSFANRDGLKVMAITSGERGVGRSTVAMHMARCAATYGMKVALVDGDTFCPSLMDQLRLDIEHGWQDCLFENIPLSEVAIHSIADRITLFPLTSVIPQQQMRANSHRIGKLIRRISTAFDMVFIDANRLNLDQREMVGVAQETIVDAAIVVVDTELSIKEKVDSAVSILQEMGLSSIGLVENFQS